MNKTLPPPIIHTRIPAALQQIFLAANRGESVDVPPDASISHLCRNWHEERVAHKSKVLPTCASFDLTDDHSISSHNDSFGACGDDILADLDDGESCTNTRHSDTIASIQQAHSQHEQTANTTATIISELSETEWSDELDEDYSNSEWSLGDSTIDSSDMCFLQEIASLQSNVIYRQQESADRWNVIETKGENDNSMPQRYESPIKSSKPNRVEAVLLMKQETTNLLKRLC
jgi:hypothetical protein